MATPPPDQPGPPADTALRRVVRGARSIFQIFAEKPLTEAQADERSIAQNRRYWDDNVALTLADLVRQAETKASGRVQTINLADFRSAIGAELWVQYQERILLIAETTIARMLNKGEVFIPIARNADQPADSWLLLFPGLSEAEALAASDAIATRIGEKLMGARFSPEDAPLPETALLDLTGAIATSGALNLDVVRSAVAKARQAQLAARKPKPLPATPKAQTRTEITTVLRPAWSTATEVEDTFFLRPIGTMGEELAIDPGLRCPEKIAVGLCATAARVAGHMATHALHAKVVLPMPYPLLYSPAGAAMKDALQAIPQKVRLLHVRVEIVATPSTVIVDQLAGLREAFRPLVREVAFLIDVFGGRHEIFNLDHITIGADLSAARGWDESDLRKALTRLKKDAGGRDTYILGLRNHDHLKIARDADIDEIGGLGLSADLEHLPANLRLLTPLALTTP